MTKLHGAHGKKTAGGKHKAGKKHEEEVEDVEEEEWEDAEDEDGTQGVALDVSSLKAIIDQLAAQQGVVAGPAAAGMPVSLSPLDVFIHLSRYVYFPLSRNILIPSCVCVCA